MSRFTTVARLAARFLGDSNNASSRQHTKRLLWVRLGSSEGGATPRKDSSSTQTKSGQHNIMEGESSAEWDRYLAGDVAGMSRVAVGETGSRVEVHWKDGHESEFPSKWLRDHCPGSFNRYTRQREVRLLYRDRPMLLLSSH